ncbi:hypothetical protein SDC9_148546 [bioreactor metagenome]|uniref:Uncharacterized protein n=1 Tax=bioreactor metagenome TaxID=1076179 RepID=A0A645EHV6_9ZZZZ
MKNDSTFKIIDLPESILFDSKSNNKLTSIGEWELINFGNNWRIELTFSESDIRPYLFSNGLLIERKISVTKNYWSIYFYDGNNDEKYIFNKISSIKQNESR